MSETPKRKPKSKPANNPNLESITKVLPREQIEPHNLRRFGTAELDESTAVRLLLKDGSTSIVLPNQAKIILGRRDRKSGDMPDVDLTPYNGIEAGVSRVHAAIHRVGSGLSLEDLASRNHTYLNDQKLISKQRRIVRNGDEVKLGRLAFTVIFDD